MDSTAKNRSITQTWFEIALWKRILTAMVIGALLGSVWGPGAEAIGWIGDLFIRLIRMIVVPLVFVTIVSGVVSMGDPSKLGSLGAKTLILYMLTTLAAITIGLILAVFLQPGVGVDLTGAPASTLQETIPLSERLISIVPENPIAALAEGNILAIIFFAILIGVGLLSVGESGKPVADFMDASSEVVLRITHWIMEIAPFGVLALIARVTGAQGFDALLNAVVLAITVLIACAAHLVLTHGVIIMQLMLKLSPINFFRGAREAMLVAFSTSSSAATLPVSMSAAEDNLGEAGRCLNGAAAWRHHQYGWHRPVRRYCVSLRSAGLWHRLDVDGLSDHGGNDDPGFGRYGCCAECVSVPDGGGNGNHWHDCATDSRDGGFHFYH